MPHIPVLLQPSIDGLALKNGDIFLDATLGGGGHSAAVAEAFGDTVQIIGIDQDGVALRTASERMSKVTKNFQAFEYNFRNLDKALDEAHVQNVDKILFDLGISSPQIEESGRGFSFKKNEPLLMTMSDKVAADESAIKFTAKDIVNTWTEEHLVDIIRGYGEERYAARIANAIVEARRLKPIATTFDLVAVIEKAVPGSYRHGRIHPATRTFQALRITVNDELGAAEEGIRKGFQILAPTGRMAVISFHSLEDRIVKRYFKSLIAEGRAQGITKKPIVPSIEEEKTNPRSRSAKLRIIEKIAA
ncbi:MAG: 16S rRNA (cytosine(1402)-N(4))-methyltransferase RsmH [Patescibacteria group bacterium]